MIIDNTDVKTKNVEKEMRGHITIIKWPTHQQNNYNYIYIFLNIYNIYVFRYIYF